MLFRTLALTLIATLASVSATLTVGAGSAAAAVSGSTSAQDQMLRNACRHHPIQYRLEVDPGTTTWQARIKVETPDDDAPEGFALSSEAGDPLEGTLWHLVCGSDSPGTWTVQGFGTYQTAPLVNVRFELPDSTFEVRRAPTRTALDTTALSGRRHRIAIDVDGFRKGRLRPLADATVIVQRRVEGRWQKVRGTRRLTTERGTAVVVVNAPSGTKVRAVTRRAGYLDGSTSRPVRLTR